MTKYHSQVELETAITLLEHEVKNLRSAQRERYRMAGRQLDADGHTEARLMKQENVRH